VVRDGLGEARGVDEQVEPVMTQGDRLAQP
jgi:hypothetical protein